jgi:hypothetical protein
MYYVEIREVSHQKKVPVEEASVQSPEVQIP